MDAVNLKNPPFSSMNCPAHESDTARLRVERVRFAVEPSMNLRALQVRPNLPWPTAGNIEMDGRQKWTTLCMGGYKV
jgi:hypothetical protein